METFSYTSGKTTVSFNITIIICEKKEEINKPWCYDLYVPRAYKIKRTYETLYLKVSDIRVRGRGYIYFRPSLPNMGHSLQKKNVEGFGNNSIFLYQGVFMNL